jgi:hypothetical protein
MVKCLSRESHVNGCLDGTVSGGDIPENQAAPIKPEARHRKASAELRWSWPSLLSILNASDTDDNPRSILLRFIAIQ